MKSPGIADIRLKGFTLALACMAQLAAAGDAYCQQTESLVAQHQRCVLLAFARDANKATDYDPTLLDSAVAECEKILAPLKKSILARTHDAAFAETILAKIRRASRRGVAVALMGLLDGKAGNKSASQQPKQPPAPAGSSGMLDTIDSNASGVQTLR